MHREKGRDTNVVFLQAPENSRCIEMQADHKNEKHSSQVWNYFI